ncbi:hypothetical protein G7Y89_g699 [Cudoniella acicularis]|uniref:Uncharacterized protein n=1 Tax=Cudoniella acicularis TaxID=354080 RepID=A0A8H4RWP5_9HELO|nr:hypothetical protein G7Y89_g699 [Cudoniella acicularis]
MPSKTEDPKPQVFTIPLVDFSKYLHGSPSEKEECIKTIMSGFTTSGFLYLTNSRISPLSEKAKAPNNNPRANRGYSGMGVEKVSNVFDTDGSAALRTQEPDVKESLEIGSEPGDYPEKKFANIWPESLPGFKEKMTWFYKRCDDLHHDLFVEKSYMEKARAVRIGSHTDYGTVTLLFQDGTGGLQVQYPNGNFYDVDPVPGAIAINCCKYSSRFCLGMSSKSDPSDGEYAARYSITGIESLWWMGFSSVDLLQGAGGEDFALS